MGREEFYNAVALELGTKYVPANNMQHNRRTNRWGPRAPGDGRFPNIGLIRFFGSRCIHISTTNPLANKVFTDCQSALVFLKELRA